MFTPTFIYMPASDKLRAAPTLSTMLMMNDTSESSSQLCLDLDEARHAYGARRTEEQIMSEVEAMR